MTGQGRKALFVAGTYFVAASVYIVVSSRLAATVAADMNALERTERIKGIVFVLVTSIVVFVATMFALKRASRDARALALQREAIVATERQATAGMMAAAIAHDANNVLTVLICELEILAKRSAENVDVHNARSAAQRLVDLNRRLLSAARQTTKVASREIDLRHAIDELLATFRPHEALRDCAISVNAAALNGSPASFRTSPVLLHQVLSNLLVNAGQATHGRGKIELRLHDVAKAWILEVHDDGPGVPKERRANLFEALVTTKPQGTGLGLYSARACASAAGFELEIDDSPLGGACFRVTLPKDQMISK